MSKGYRVRIYMDYSKMHHITYKKNSYKEEDGVIALREKTKEEELMVLRMADGREVTTGALKSRDQMQRGIKAGNLDENVVVGEAKHGVRFWTDAMNVLLGDKSNIPYSVPAGNDIDIFTAFEDFLRSKGFEVKRVSKSPEYFLPL